MGWYIFEISGLQEFAVIIIPAIDLNDGKCVRLLQGDFEKVTVYSYDPVTIAKTWQDKGAERIHIVDLDGSRYGSPRNRHVIQRIVGALDIPVQVGGGIRNMEAVDAYLQMGVAWVILGTAALKDNAFVQQACRACGDSIIVGIDGKDGEIMVEGWTEGTGQSVIDVAKRYEGLGIHAIVYTDIKRDGMERGVNIDATTRMAESVDIPVIASGGVASLKDIMDLLEVERSGIMGVITGKALYTGALKLEEAVRAAR
jgi:phosphoribosylformimino-5-aminoimidazole carboxamide ribotide isomerase